MLAGCTPTMLHRTLMRPHGRLSQVISPTLHLSVILQVTGGRRATTGGRHSSFSTVRGDILCYRRDLLVVESDSPVWRGKKMRQPANDQCYLHPLTKAFSHCNPMVVSVTT